MGKKFPGKFSFFIYKDPGTTGNFEWTLFKDKEDDSGEGMLVHSKKMTDRWIHTDYEAFFDDVEEALQH